MALAASMTAETIDLRGAPAAVRSAFKLMARNWGVGALDVELPGGRKLAITGPQPGPQAVLTVRDYRFMRRCLSSGAIGFAEGCMAGEA